MTNNYDMKWLFVLGGPETHLHHILWAIHDVKNRGRSEGEENFGDLPVMVGGRGRAMQCGLCVSLAPSYVRTCVRACMRERRTCSLTEPERGVRLLNPSYRSIPRTTY
jgi:hypothetical protein